MVNVLHCDVCNSVPASPWEFDTGERVLDPVEVRYWPKTKTIDLCDRCKSELLAFILRRGREEVGKAVMQWLEQKRE